MKHFIDRNKDCIGCRKCEEVCTQHALDIMGKDVTVSELMEIIMQDYDFTSPPAVASPSAAAR